MSSTTVPLSSYVPFANVSVEVFAIIAEHLDLQDIQSCRLAGRLLYSLSSPYLCRTITFAPHQEDLDRLDAISQDHLLSHHTRTLRYDTTILTLPDVNDALLKLEFPDYWSNDAWGRIPRDNLLFEALESPMQYDIDHTNFKEFVREQDVILEHLEEHLQHIFSAFPKLSKIIFCNSYWKNNIRFKFAIRENSISRQWVRRHQLLPLLKVLQNTPNCNISRIEVQGNLISAPYSLLDNCDFGDDSDIPGSIKYCLGPAFLAACYPKERIPFIHGSALSLNTDELLMTQTIISNLTHLNIGIFTAEAIEEFYMDPKDVPKKYWADLPLVLKSLTKVVDLSLDMKVRRVVDQQHGCSYYHDDILEVFEHFQSPRLKRLKLSQFRSCGSSVMDLLLKHPMLTDLSLKFIIEIETRQDVWHSYVAWTPDPQWVECIEVMRRLKLPRLQLQGIEGFGHNSSRFGSENENLTLSRIHDYILHGYGDNPLLTRLPVELNGLEWDRELW